MTKNFCLACGRLVDTEFAEIGFCNYYNIYKHTPTQRCSWNHPHSRGTLEWRVRRWREHSERLLKKAQLLEEYLQSSCQTTNIGDATK